MRYWSVDGFVFYCLPHTNCVIIGLWGSSKTEKCSFILHNKYTVVLVAFCIDSNIRRIRRIFIMNQQSSRTEDHVIWCIGTSVLEEAAASILKVEIGRSRFLQNLAVCINNIVSFARRLWSWYSCCDNLKSFTL